MFEKNKKLLALEVIMRRGNFNHNHKYIMHREVTGYRGEKRWSELLNRHLKSNPLIIYDYRFEVNNVERQIDCLLIFDNEFYIIEVKNYKGEYYYQDGMMFFNKTNVILESQPFIQLETTKQSFIRLLREEGIYARVSAKVVFINSNFHLYDCKRTLPAIYVGTALSFVNSLNSKPCTKDHSIIINALFSRRVKQSKHDVPIDISLKDLKKGITCTRCSGWMEEHTRKFIKCNTCGNIEALQKGILRSFKEYSYVFPEDKITVTLLSKWINHLAHRNTILKVLSEHGIASGKNKGRYYSVKE